MSDLSLPDELRELCTCERSGEHGFTTSRCEPCLAAERIEDLEMMLNITVQHPLRKCGFICRGDIWHRNALDSPTPWRISFGTMRPVDVPDYGNGLPMLTPEARASIRAEESRS